MSEGIDDVETFLELNDQDFSRLRMKTKLIKTIQKLQNEYMNDPIIEELVEDPLDITEDPKSDEEPATNPYHGILLEKVECSFIF